ncbi:MAG: DUF1156 domain-containing protein, partial [Planctomycetaceae bacterium]|nr:DUF1156 domain-containing protein [Planctomycetaceae bacterium]
MKYKKKLIEVALPLEAINAESAREKSIRHGHPSTLHLWWARRPLAAARAVIFSSLVDDPSSKPDEFPTEEAQNAERQRLFGILEQLVKWENSNNQDVLAKAKAEIMKSTNGNPPALLDPFAGGGAIPLEAQRLGLEAHASDLNPVAVMINKAMIEIPPKFAGQPPVNPKSLSHLGTNPGTRASNPGTRASSPPPSPTPFKGWHSRGYLPHFDSQNTIQSITFRLADSVPASVITAWKKELNISKTTPADDQSMAELRKKIDIYEDAGYGNCYLGNPQIAKVVMDALFHFDGKRYCLLEWCIMPNHVHVMIKVFNTDTTQKIIHSWKSFISNRANAILGLSGPFWMPDYYDRYIRDEKHFNAVCDYIRNNPVKVGLVKEQSDWDWGSAKARDAGWKPAFPEDADKKSAFSEMWQGTRGLAEDVRYY